MKPPKALRVFLFLLIAAALVAGCTKGSARPSPESSSQQKEGVYSLEKLEEDVNKLIKAFEKDYMTEKASQSAGQEQGQQQQKQGGGSEGEDKKKEEGTQDSQGERAQQGGNQGPDWAKYEEMVFLIHDKWNDFREQALQEGAPMDEIMAFNEKLNEVTTTLTRQDLFGGLLTANELYLRTVAFERIFGMGSAASAKRTMYYLRDAAYRALNGQRDEALKSAEKAREEWEVGKGLLRDEVMANRVEFSLLELREAVEIEDPNLIKIKYQIAEKNIEEAEKKMEKK
ncbi:MAG: hypothetical protein DIU66_001780 [Bacillota bacterium]